VNFNKLINYSVRKSYNYLNIIKHGFKGKVIEMPMDKITNEYAFSYSKNGWNYLVQIIKEYEECPGIRFENSSYYKLFLKLKYENIETFTDILFLHDKNKRKELPKIYFGTKPWGCSIKKYINVGGRPWGYYYDKMNNVNTKTLHFRNLWYLPGETESLKFEWNKTINLYNQIKKEGYKPFLKGTLPEVYLLINKNEEVMAVRFNGQHRIAVLSYLGFDTIKVLVSDESAGVIREDEIDQWFYVKEKLINKYEALCFFNAFFKYNGSERLRYLNEI